MEPTAARRLSLGVLLVASSFGCASSSRSSTSGEAPIAVAARPPAPLDAATDPSGDAGVPDAAADAHDSAAEREATCPEWRLPSHRAFARAQRGPAAARLATMSTCCRVNATDVLCREIVTANHVVGAMSGTRLVGLTEASGTVWLDVPIMVGEHETMRFPPRTLVMLTLTTEGSRVTLERSAGTCPRACARPGRTCRGAEREAQRACEGIGGYEAGRGREPPP